MSKKTRHTAELAKEETQVRIILNESGTSGLKEYGGFVSEAYLAQYTWPSVSSTFARIRRSCPEMLMVGGAFSAWGRNSDIIVDLPDKPSDAEKEYHEFVYEVFDDIEGGKSQLIETMVRRTPFDGFFVWETPFGKRELNWTAPSFRDIDGKSWKDTWKSQYDDGRIGIRRFAARDTSTFAGWEFDGHKKAIAFKQLDYPNPEVILPLERCLHLVFGDVNNPEGMSPLEAIARLETLKRGYETVMGIGSEHVAGHLRVQKTTAGALSTTDKQNVADAARAILSAQEGNFALWPYGLEGQVVDIPFAAAAAILETIKYYSVEMLAVYMMQFIAYNIFTRTGALSSATDSSQIAVFTFNAMLDGFAAQLDNQIGRRLYQLNKDSFPGLERRPKIRFKHVEKTVALSEMGVFFNQLNGILPLGDEDYRAIRERSGFLPKNLPEVVNQPTKPAIPNGTNPQGDPANETPEVPEDETDAAMMRLEQLAQQHDPELYAMFGKETG
jgi:hypothetical protein